MRQLLAAKLKAAGVQRPELHHPPARHVQLLGPEPRRRCSACAASSASTAWTPAASAWPRSTAATSTPWWPPSPRWSGTQPGMAGLFHACGAARCHTSDNRANCRCGLRVFTEAGASVAMQHLARARIIAALHNSGRDCQPRFSAHVTRSLTRSHHAPTHGAPTPMLYQLYETQRALMAPFSEFASASAKLYNHPLSPFAQRRWPSACRPASTWHAPPGQGIREARVRHHHGAGRRCRGGGAGTGGR
jgi:hypothetical protein